MIVGAKMPIKRQYRLCILTILINTKISDGTVFGSGWLKLKAKATVFKNKSNLYIVIE